MPRKRSKSHQKDRQVKVRKKLLLESIEERILCSATVDPAATFSENEFLAAAAFAPTTTTTTSAPVPTADTALAPAAAAPSPTPVASTSVAPLPTDGSQLTDEQRAALQSVVKDSTNQIWFQENVGQFAEGVLYGFKTQFGGMLVYADHLSILSNQTDPVTGAVGIHTVNITFNGSTPWQIVPGGESGVLGTYQQADGTALSPHIFEEITLRNVYDGVDLRLYSAEKGILEFDWLVAKAQDYSKIRMDFTGQDGLVFNADGSATLDLRYQDLTLKMPEVYQVIDGQKQLLGAAMVAGDQPGELRYSLTGNIVADQPLVIDPNVAWSSYFELNDPAFDSYAYAIAVNATGVYVMGWTVETITNGSFGNYMQVNAGFSQGTAAGQNYIYRFNTAGTNITAWTSTGVLGSAGNNPPSDLELFPDGRALALFSNGLIQIYSADLATRSFSGEPVNLSSGNSVAIVDNSNFYVGGIVSAAIPVGELAAANIGPDATFAGTTEGAIVRYSNATTTPTANWATYVGGDSNERFTAVALTPNATKLVFATFSESGTLASYPTLVNAIDSTLGGTTELLAGVLNQQATKPAAFDVFSFLGGSSTEGTTGTNTGAAVITAVNGGFWVGGNTASTDLPGTTGSAQAANGGGNDAFISYIPINGSAGAGFRSTYLGGSGNEIVGGIAYDPFRDRVFLFGTTTGGTFPTLDTTPTSIYFDNTFGGGAVGDIFVSTFSGNLVTKNYATYIGGTFNDYLGDTGMLRGTGHVTYSSATDQVYLATTVHSNLPTTVIGPTIPGFDTVRTNPESASADAQVIFAFNINIYDHGDAPATYEAGTPAEEAISLFIRLGATVDAETAPFSGAAATGDDTANTGSADDEDAITAALPVLFTTDTSYTVSNISVLNNTGAAQTLQGWIDFNGDGVFGANERATVVVPASGVQQNVSLTWSSLPGITGGQRYLRLRFTDTIPVDNGATTVDERSIGTDATGHGEVEDFALTITTTPTLSVSDVTATEGTDNYAVFTVTLSNTSPLATTFNLALANVSATGGGTDYGTGGAGNLQVSSDGITYVDAASATVREHHGVCAHTDRERHSRREQRNLHADGHGDGGQDDECECQRHRNHRR
jgi:hypothetical protein